MILVDSSVWIDHFRSGDALLGELLMKGRVLAHPHVIGELALGGMRQRGAILHELRRLAKAEVANDEEVLDLIERHALAGTGIGYVDAHLLAAALLTPEASLWSRDRRLQAAAKRMGIAAEAR